MSQLVSCLTLVILAEDLSDRHKGWIDVGKDRANIILNVLRN